MNAAEQILDLAFDADARAALARAFQPVADRGEHGLRYSMPTGCGWNQFAKEIIARVPLKDWGKEEQAASIILLRAVKERLEVQDIPSAFAREFALLNAA